MKNISILGSTGSIGTNALKIIRENKDKFNLVAISGNYNYKEIIKQIKEFNPKYVSIGTEEGYQAIRKEYPKLNLFLGEEGLKEIGKLDEHDILLTAVSGSVGLEATIEAIKKEKRIALANKETLVAGGDLIKKLLKEYRAEIIPVDSEHGAIFQCLKSGNRNEVSRIILTASGGPFRGKDTEFLKKVILADALKHPNWSMGVKITIDSATLVNKGLEVIEAHHLFDIDYDDIEVVVHRQSIIHSMVEFIDKSIIAQMGEPDMKIPIMYSFTYPDRIENRMLDKFDFFKYNELTFEKPDMETFKGLKYAFEAGRKGGTAPIVYNAANEVAVSLFLNKKIDFLKIYDIIEEMIKSHKKQEVESIEMIKQVDFETREIIKRKYI